MVISIGQDLAHGAIIVLQSIFEELQMETGLMEKFQELKQIFI